jgi:metallo-beta-lactamase family protein
MADKTTEVFEKYKQYLNDEVKKDLLTGDPFDFPGLTHIKHGRDSAEIDNMVGPKVIISGSGMMTGGRILSHAQHYLPIETTRLLIVGYQAESTLGRRILEGDQNVMIQGLNVHIAATVSETQSMSSHAGQTQLMSWLKNIKGVKKIILTHGEDPQRGVLSEKIKSDLGIVNVDTPHLNEEIVVNVIEK